MHSLIRAGLMQLNKLLLPYCCALCDMKSELQIDLCSDCKQLLVENQPSCWQCGNAMQTHHTICGKCLKHPPHYERTIFVGQYEHYLKKLILDLKFHDKLFLSKVLGTLLAEKLKLTLAELPECILPVPLHPKRLRERGFNQAVEIGKIVAKALQLPLDYKLCQRIKFTQPQSVIPAEARISNIKSAFEVKKRAPYQHIAIIDDVITTGCTVNEMSRYLKKAGVKRIQVWCIARTFE